MSTAVDYAAAFAIACLGVCALCLGFCAIYSMICEIREKKP